MSEPIKIAEKETTRIKTTKAKPKKGETRITENGHIEVYIE